MRPKPQDESLVASQYVTEDSLEARRSIYADVEGPDAKEVAFAAIAEGAPQRVLEVGGGPGELAERIGRELGAGAWGGRAGRRRPGAALRRR